MKILYNTCYGGFSFSDEFIVELNRRFPEKRAEAHAFELRTDPEAIALFEELGPVRSSGPHSSLKIRNIPDGMDWDIDEYDGKESIQWDLPKNKILKEFIDIIKGRKTIDTVTNITRLVLEEDGDMTKVRQSIL